MLLDASKKIRRQLESAEGFLMLEMPEHALKELNKVDNPGKLQFHVCLLKGDALRGLLRHDEALEQFQLAHKLDPNDLNSMLGMAWCYKRVDRLNESIEVMREAYSAHSDIPVVLYNLACYYALAGEKEQALSWLGRALRMDDKLAALVPDESDFD
ncbi:MAG: hypothetical protein FJ267_07290, partial [Planctomycetes bacterium]|nr:hypothetical protein [Planctomycetota bacterium]